MGLGCGTNGLVCRSDTIGISAKYHRYRSQVPVVNGGKISVTLISVTSVLCGENFHFLYLPVIFFVISAKLCNFAGIYKRLFAAYIIKMYNLIYI